MVDVEMFTADEQKLIYLATLWNNAEARPDLYDKLFVSNPHDLAKYIGNNTTFNDWQLFISDTRVQNYIDKIIYTQAGIIVNKALRDGVHLSQAESARLNTAIKYRDDHKPDFATPVKYIYMNVPLTPAEEEFLPPESRGTAI